MTHEFNDGKPTKIHSIDDINYSLLEKGTIRLDKSVQVPSPSEWGIGLEESDLGFHKGANTVYRDSKARNSIQVREYDEYYTIQLDHANPSEGRIIEHYQLDLSPEQKLKFIGGGIALAGVVLWALTQG